MKSPSEPGLTDDRGPTNPELGAIAIWKLASPDCYRLMTNQFGIGNSTVDALEMDKAIIAVFHSQLVQNGSVPE